MAKGYLTILNDIGNVLVQLRDIPYAVLDLKKQAHLKMVISCIQIHKNKSISIDNKLGKIQRLKMAGKKETQVVNAILARGKRQLLKENY